MPKKGKLSVDAGRERANGTLVAAVGEVLPRVPAPCNVPELYIPLTAAEEAFARLFVVYNNATKAYIEAYAWDGKRYVARQNGWNLTHKPNVMQRIREYESAAAQRVVIDYAAILEHDNQIVQAQQHMDQVTQYIWQCCRHCHGEAHAYQWIDYGEFLKALQANQEENETRVESGQRIKEMPSEEGGYGFDPQDEPNILCPKCEGRGRQVAIIADTTKLTGPARAAVIGIKQGAQGQIEVLLHDVDAAKNRLLRAGGYLQSDSQAIARGAAQGAAAGAIMATQAAAERAEKLTTDEAQRLYLELA